MVPPKLRYRVGSWPPQQNLSQLRKLISLSRRAKIAASDKIEIALGIRCTRALSRSRDPLARTKPFNRATEIVPTFQGPFRVLHAPMHYEQWTPARWEPTD
jgi:hypothetical protein